MNYKKILENVSRHIDLNKAEIDFFISLIEHKTIRKKEMVLKEGKICKATIFVNSGCLRSYYSDDSGIHTLQLAIDNWWIGDLKSFVQQCPARLCIDALMDTEILQISKQKIDQLYKHVPKFERFFRMQMENALIAHQERILQSLTLTSEMRYEHFVKSYPAFYQRIPLKDIANYLGITPEYLSAIRSNAVK